MAAQPQRERQACRANQGDCREYRRARGGEEVETRPDPDEIRRKQKAERFGDGVAVVRQFAEREGDERERKQAEQFDRAEPKQGRRPLKSARNRRGAARLKRMAQQRGFVRFLRRKRDQPAQQRVGIVENRRVQNQRGEFIRRDVADFLEQNRFWMLIDRQAFVRKVVVPLPAEQRRVGRERRRGREPQRAVEQQAIIIDGERIAVGNAQNRAVEPFRGEQNHVRFAELPRDSLDFLRAVRRIKIERIHPVFARISIVKRHERRKFPEFRQNQRSRRNMLINRPRRLRARVVAAINRGERDGIRGGIAENPC